jgi:predicted ArsR family transcriptional regulator
VTIQGEHTNAQIARRLGISEGTVRTHLEDIYGRLNVSSRTAADLRAFSDRVTEHRRRDSRPRRPAAGRRPASTPSRAGTSRERYAA